MTFWCIKKNRIFSVSVSHRSTEEDFTLTLTVDDRNATTVERLALWKFKYDNIYRTLRHSGFH